MAAYFGPCLALYAAWALGARLAAGQGLAHCGIGAMGSVFGNTVLIGVPVVERLHGAAGLRLLVMIVSIHSALLFTATTMLAEAGRGRADGRAALAGTARMMSRNPMVLSIAAGAVFGALELRLPAPADAALAMLGGATAPLALLAAGAGLAAFRIGAQLGACALVASVKLCLFPLAVWAVARHVAGLDPLAVAVATLAAALPTGTNVYVIARRYDASVPVAAGSVLLTTLLSAATIPAVVLAVGR
jgi:predicted permease